MDPLAVPCVFCCGQSSTLHSFSSSNDPKDAKDVLHVILGLGVDKKEAFHVLKEPFKGLPLCKECDKLYVHLLSLMVHLKSIQEKISDLAGKVVEKVVTSGGKEEEKEFVNCRLKNGKPRGVWIRDNCKRVRDALKSKGGCVGGQRLAGEIVLKEAGREFTAVHLNVKVEVSEADEEVERYEVPIDLSYSPEVIDPPSPTPLKPDGGMIRIKALSALMEEEIITSPKKDFQDTLIVNPEDPATEKEPPSSPTVPSPVPPQPSVPQPPPVQPMDEDTSSDSDLFRLLSRPNPPQRGTLPCPGRKAKGCMEMFCTKAELMEHVMASHTSMNTPVVTTPQARLKKCYFCTVILKHHKDVRRHLRIHTREAPYFCRVCKKAEEEGTSKSSTSSSKRPNKPSPSFRNTEDLRRHLHLKHKELFNKKVNLKETCEEYRKQETKLIKPLFVTTQI